MILEVKDGCFGYFGQPVIFDHINLSLEKGHILAILGPNGIGKTTLLKCMIGLLPWKRGQTLLNGQNIAKMKPADIWKTVSYIPQSHGFAFSYTGLEMVMLGRSSHMGTFQQPGAREIEMAERMMEKVGITRLAYKDCNRMSGGELQMVLIARARRADVHARADALGARERLGNGGDETAVAGREALLHKGGKAADVVHADLARGAVHCLRDGDKVIPAPARDERHGRNGHALIHDGNAEFALNGLAHGDKVVRLAADLFVDLIRGSLDIADGAVEKAQPQRDRAHVKMLLLDHPDGLDDLVGIEEIAHGVLLRSGAWRRKCPAAARAPRARAPRRRSGDAARAYRTAFRTRQDRRA